MQFNRVCDLCDVKGNCLETHLEPLPKPSVDTGAGLERLAAVLQGKISNFDTDLFTPLIHRAAELTDTEVGASPRTDASLRIIADHARASTFLISDGVIPSNEGRGYVLRKILRRGIRHARLLEKEKPFLFEMAGEVNFLMGGAYPELSASLSRTEQVILHEEERFARTLDTGLKKLSDDLSPLFKTEWKKTPSDPPESVVMHEFPPDIYDGAKAFKLYDTYGLSLARQIRSKKPCDRGQFRPPRLEAAHSLRHLS